jgi:hypothetical protein
MDPDAQTNLKIEIIYCLTMVLFHPVPLFKSGQVANKIPRQSWTFCLIRANYSQT